jgi:hypothetical protein
MKFGDSGTAESYDAEGHQLKSFRYWVQPDRKFTLWLTHIAQVDRAAEQEQTDRMKYYLQETLTPGSWMVQGSRFFFENRSDWEMFKTMCVWQEAK